MSQSIQSPFITPSTVDSPFPSMSQRFKAWHGSSCSIKVTIKISCSKKFNNKGRAVSNCDANLSVIIQNHSSKLDEIEELRNKS